MSKNERSLYENQFLDKKGDEKISKLRQEKLDNPKSIIAIKLEDKNILDYIMRAIEDFLFEYSEVTDIENFECYCMGWSNKDSIQKEINSLN